MKLFEALKPAPRKRTLYVCLEEIAAGLRNTTEAEVAALMEQIRQKYSHVMSKVTPGQQWWTYIPKKEFDLYDEDYAEVFDDRNQFVQYVSNYFDFGEAMPGILDAIGKADDQTKDELMRRTEPGADDPLKNDPNWRKKLH